MFWSTFKGQLFLICAQFVPISAGLGPKTDRERKRGDQVVITPQIFTFHLFRVRVIYVYLLYYIIWNHILGVYWSVLITLNRGIFYHHEYLFLFVFATYLEVKQDHISLLHVFKYFCIKFYILLLFLSIWDIKVLSVG